jgi:hypothetical protein
LLEFKSYFVRVQELQTLSKEVQENKVKAILVLQKKIKHKDIEVDAPNSRKQKRQVIYTNYFEHIFGLSSLQPQRNMVMPLEHSTI